MAFQLRVIFTHLHQRNVGHVTAVECFSTAVYRGHADYVYRQFGVNRVYGLKKREIGIEYISYNDISFPGY
jgi:hypothetical protein